MKPPTAPLVPSASRYPGTRPFGDSDQDAACFFGREQESEELYLRILSVSLVVQFGRSGLGKTSLLQAGVFPRLRRAFFIPVLVRLNIDGETLVHAVSRSMRQACDAQGVRLNPGEEASGLQAYIRGTTVWDDERLLMPVLVFDQFEEVFTLRESGFRASLAAELGSLTSARASAASGTKLVISLREEFVGALQELSAAIPGLFRERMRLEPLRHDAAREAIIEPARLQSPPGGPEFAVAPFEFDAAAIDAMLDFLKGSSGVIEPFQLQLLCRHAEKLALGLQAPNRSVILHLANFDSASFDSVLKNFYRDTLAKLGTWQRGRARELCEVGLLDQSGHRLMLEERQIQERYRVSAASLATLAEQRLVRREPRLESVFYEISHDRLAESIDKARRFRLPKNIRHSLLAVTVLGPVVVVSALLWVKSIDETRRQAETLAQYLLGESLLDGLRDIGSSDMLDEIKAATERYVNDGRRGEDFTRALARRNAGDIEMTQNTRKEALVHFTAALKDLHAAKPTSQLLREIARTQDRIVEVYADQGRLADARAHNDAATKIWRSLAAAPDGQVSDCNHLGSSLLMGADLRHRNGQADAALDAIQEGLRAVGAVLFGDLSATPVCAAAGAALHAVTRPHPDTVTLQIFSRAVLLRAVIFNSEAEHQAAVAFAEKAHWLQPQSSFARKDQLVALAARAGMSTYGAPERALAEYRRVLSDIEEMLRRDPRNRQWQREKAAMQLLIGEAILQCRQAPKRCATVTADDDAASVTLHAIGTLRALLASDDTNASLRGDLIWALQNHAAIYESRQRHDARLKTLEEALRIHREAGFDPDDADKQLVLARVLADKAETLHALGRALEASQSMDPAVEILATLVSRHPTHPLYSANLEHVLQRDERLPRASDAAPVTATRAKQRSLVGARQVETAAGRSAKSEARAKDYTARLQAREAATSEAGTAAGQLEFYREGWHSWLDHTVSTPSEPLNYHWLSHLQGRMAIAHEALVSSALDDAERRQRVESRVSALRAAMHAASMSRILVEDRSAAERIDADARLWSRRRELGAYLYQLQRSDEAIEIAQEDLADARRLVQGQQQQAGKRATETDDATKATHVVRMAQAQYGIALIRRQLKQPGWEEALQSGLIHLEHAASLAPKDASPRKEMGHLRHYLGEQLAAEGQAELAALEFDAAIAAFREASARNPADEDVRSWITMLTHRRQLSVK